VHAQRPPTIQLHADSVVHARVVYAVACTMVDCGLEVPRAQRVRGWTLQHP